MSLSTEGARSWLNIMSGPDLFDLAELLTHSVIGHFFRLAGTQDQANSSNPLQLRFVNPRDSVFRIVDVDSARRDMRPDMKVCQPGGEH
jgi:hypothetical protein